MEPTESQNPGLHPEPPEDLNSLNLPLVTLNGTWFRVHQSQHHPIYFGTSGRNRFDAPAQEYGILYLGVDECCAFRESIGRLTKYRIVTKTLLQGRRISEITANRPLNLVDLTGAGLTKIGADGRLCTGDYGVSQRWALALRNHPEKPDGLYYRSRHDPSRYCLALYDHLEAELNVTITHDFLGNSFKPRLAHIFNIYEYGYVED